MKYLCKKSFLLLLMISFMIISSFITGSMGTVLASSSTQAFNTGTGTLNVDYAGYLSKHDIVFNQLITTPKSGITVGNGKVGAMVWNANGLTMQVQGVDASEECFASEGLVNLYTNPGMDTGYSTYQQRLSLYDGLVTTRYDSNRTVTIMGSPNSEVMGIHVDDSRGGVSSITLDLSIWNVSSFGGGDVPDINTWRTVSTYNDSNGAGISRGQTDANHFGYTLAASVEGASFSTSVVNSSKVRLTITPTSSYTIWIACASRLNAPNYDSVNQAKNLLTSVKSTGYATTLSNYKNWWHNFWGKSFVQYSGLSGDADYLENIYYLSTYMIAAGGYGNYPFHFINGVFSGVNDDDSSKWSNAYWYWNQRDIYNSFFASNHAEMMNVFSNMYSRNFNTLKSYTMTRYGIDGIWVPETMGWNGSAAGTIGSDFVNDTYSTGTEAAQNMYRQYKYTNDSNYLRNTAYPFMKEVCKFYCSKLSFNSSTGKYYMASSNAHETYWDVRDAITDLAAVRSLFPITIKTAQQFGLDSSLVTQWQNVLNNLDPYPIDPNDPNKYFPHTPPASTIRNGENITSELVWPYDLIGIGSSDYQKGVNDWNSRPFYGANVWGPDAVQAARLGLGDGAYSYTKAVMQKYQNYPNGRTTDTNGEFEYLGVMLSAINESLLHSYNDKIRVFPSLPNNTSFISKFTLLASGGFLVSSEKEANEIKYVGIKSLYGNTATVVNPWGTQQVQVRRVSDNAIILTSSSSEFNFSTAANTVYVVERTAKLLSGYSYELLTGTANRGVKSLTGTSCTLGSGTGSGPTPTPPVNTPTPTPTAGPTPTPGGSPLDRTGWVASGTGSSFSNAFDGNATTRWSTDALQVNGQYFQVDMQSAKTFNKIRLDTTGSANDYPRGYQVFVSSDGTNWGSAIANGAGSNAITDITFTTQTARYLKIVQTGSAPSNYWSIHEFNAYNTNGGSVAPIGKNISLKCVGNNSYISSENGTASMNCNRASAGAWETFQVVDAGNGNIALKGYANDVTASAYVCSENGGVAMNCNRTSFGPWETFTWVANSDGTISLRGNNGQYVTGASPMWCNVTTASSSEKFQVTTY